MYAAGYNGFGQISITSNQPSIKTPEKLTLSCRELLPSTAKCLVFISWSSIGLVNESNDLIVRGFVEEGERQSINLGPFPSCTKIGTVTLTKHDNLYFINNEGRLSRLNVKENVNDIKRKQCIPATEEHVLRHICISEVTKQLYLLTDVGRLLFCALDKNGLLQPPSDISMPIPTPCIIDKFTCGISHCLALSVDGLVFSWGTGSRGQLGHGKLNDENAPKLVESLQGLKIVSVSAGGWHSAALADTGDLYVWGCNKHGQLGFPAHKDSYSSGSFKKVSGEDSQNSTGEIEWTVPMLCTPTLLELEEHLNSKKFITIRVISCGARHSAAVTSSGQAVTWGWSKYGQLSHECCIATECNKKRSMSMNEKKMQFEDCSDKPHLPRFVSYFNDKNLIVRTVECGHWNTVYQTEIKTET